MAKTSSTQLEEGTTKDANEMEMANQDNVVAKKRTASRSPVKERRAPSSARSHATAVRSTSFRIQSNVSPAQSNVSPI
eukprot:10033270-Ditylum_brightwellii.AAC.1